LSSPRLLHRPPPSSPLSPYTTLFRSSRSTFPRPSIRLPLSNLPPGFCSRFSLQEVCRVSALRITSVLLVFAFLAAAGRLASAERSEEHTSELQSRENLVCRLLLEKKK